MPIGQVLLCKDDTTVVYFSPWFVRGGNKATFVCDLIATDALTSFEIEVETKKAENDDSGKVTVGAAQSIALGGGFNTQTAFQRGDVLDGGGQGFEELVRYKYSLTMTSTGSAIGWMHFRMLGPAWLTG